MGVPDHPTGQDRQDDAEHPDAENAAGTYGQQESYGQQQAYGQQSYGQGGGYPGQPG